MIGNLKIRNYALIDQLEIGFIPGFITITGETGAGKSILLGALSLILGQRADSSVLLDKNQKCIVEGEFKIAEHLQAFFEDHDLDFDAVTFLRREILPSGKSRAFINDTPVNLHVLKELGDQLVDIHSQHQSLKMNDHSYQLQVVDIVGSNESELNVYQSLFKEFKGKNQELTRLNAEIESIRGELDFFQYQYDELCTVNLDDLEIDQLENEVSKLENVEEIKLSLDQTSEALEGEGQILTLLNEALSVQKKIKALNVNSEEYYSRLETAYIDLKDLASEIAHEAEIIDGDPEQLQKYKVKLDLVYSLLQKHKVREISELIRLRDQFSEKIQTISFSDDTISKLEKELQTIRDLLMEKAKGLHERRVNTASEISQKVVVQLKQLGIPNARFTVTVDQRSEPDQNGLNDVKFLFSANKQGNMEEISRVASGGEISRLMLCIKSLLSDYKGLPTLIFDEIDTGVSGEIAEKMGQIMKNMSSGRQVIAITHLPQVASQGQEHFLVYKEDEENQTKTLLRKLTEKERITELAKLLSGEQLTEAALLNARELLRNGQ